MLGGMTTLTSPHDLLAAVPFLVGYQPEESLVLISLTRNLSGDESIGMAMRIDFLEEMSADQIDTLVGHLERDRATGALIVAYLPENNFGGEELVESIQAAITSRDITVRESIIVKSGRWRSTICADAHCCPAHGSELPIFSDSRITAEQVGLGKPLPFARLSDLVGSISALPVDCEIVEELMRLNEIDYEENPTTLQREGAQVMLDLIKEFETEGICRDKSLIALLLVRLKDLQVRDFALGSVTDETIDLYWNFWRWLVRIAPAGYVAPVATLFAAISYEKGDGALAQKALHRADEDQPAYPLTALLRQVFSAGWPPETFASMRADLHPKICGLLFSE